MCERILGTCTDVKYLILKCSIKRALLITFLWWIYWYGETFWVTAGGVVMPNCNIIKAKEIIIADCSSKGLTLDIPQDIDENIKVLNLSRNSVRNISDHSFEKYKDNLKMLDLSYLSRSHPQKFEFSTESFTSLFNLEYLDLTNSCWSKNFVLPPKIKTLKIENCSVSVSLVDLSSLEELYAAGNSWTHSPDFHILAPLKYIDLRRNALFDFDVEKIASFCELKTLRLDSFPSRELPRDFHNGTTYCSCKAVDFWLANVKIEHDHLECLPPPGTTPKCDVSPSEYTMKMRRECLARTAGRATSSTKTNWLVIGVTILILLVLLIPTIIVTRKRLRRKSGRHDQDDESEEEEEEEEEEED